MHSFSKILRSSLIIAFSVSGTAIAAHAAKPTIKIGYVQSWPSSNITTHLAADAIKEKLGNPVDLVASTAGPMWEGVASDHLDAMLTAWLPATHKTYYEKLWTKVLVLGPNVMGTRLGIAVPKYVPVNTISGLKKYANKFQHRIVGVGAGAGININTEKAIKAYHLSGFNLQTSSTAAMTAQLNRAIRNKQWIAVTAWAPMWMWAKFPIKFLKDPQHIYGKGGYIANIVNPKLFHKSPKVFSFFNRFSLPRQQLSLMMLKVKNGTNIQTVIHQWMSHHKKLVNSWFS